MSRPLRIEYPGAWYHVLNRGSGRREIFRSNHDRVLFLDLLGETIKTYGIEVHAYALLPNHYHLLIHTPAAGISRAMRHLIGVYTQKVNRRWKSDGPIFRGRFKAILVETEEYLTELVRYIHLNPVRAGLCLHPKDHQWTSHEAYLQKGKRPPWLEVNEVLLRFGRTEREALQEMDRFVGEGVPERFEEVLKNQRGILGTKGFCEWVAENFMDGKRDQKGVPLKDRRPRPKISLKEIMEIVGHTYGISGSALRQSRSGVRNDARSMAVYLARSLTGLPQQDLAGWFRAKDANAIGQGYYRFRRRLLKERKLRIVTKTLERTILNKVKP
ncbi:MAG: transposase [Deltaproteobacteria bacterium]|nr:transposase [Deltaproteobacteria bacterium]